MLHLIAAPVLLGGLAYLATRRTAKHEEGVKATRTQGTETDAPDPEVDPKKWGDWLLKPVRTFTAQVESLVRRGLYISAVVLTVFAVLILLIMVTGLLGSIWPWVTSTIAHALGFRVNPMTGTVTVPGGGKKG